MIVVVRMLLQRFEVVVQRNCLDDEGIAIAGFADHAAFGFAGLVELLLGEHGFLEGLDELGEFGLLGASWVLAPQVCVLLDDFDQGVYHQSAVN